MTGVCGFTVVDAAITRSPEPFILILKFLYFKLQLSLNFLDLIHTQPQTVKPTRTGLPEKGRSPDFVFILPQTPTPKPQTPNAKPETRNPKP